MSKSIRYQDGTRIMPGTEAIALIESKNQEGLDKHMAELDAKWRKAEGRKPTKQLNMREKMLEGKIPWDPVLLKCLNFVNEIHSSWPEDAKADVWVKWEKIFSNPEFDLKTFSEGPTWNRTQMFGWPSFTNMDPDLLKEIKEGMAEFSEANSSLADSLLKSMKGGVPESTEFGSHGILKMGFSPLNNLLEQLENPQNCSAKKSMLDRLRPDPLAEYKGRVVAFTQEEHEEGFKDVTQIGFTVISNGDVERIAQLYWEGSSPYLFSYFQTTDVLDLEERILNCYGDYRVAKLVMVQKALGIKTATWGERFDAYKALCTSLLEEKGLYIPYKGDVVKHGHIAKSRFHPSGRYVAFVDGQY